MDKRLVVKQWSNFGLEFGEQVRLELKFVLFKLGILFGNSVCGEVDSVCGGLCLGTLLKLIFL